MFTSFFGTTMTFLIVLPAMIGLTFTLRNYSWIAVNADCSVGKTTHFCHALNELLEAEKLMHADYFVLHRIGMIYLYVPELANLENALAYFTRAGKYAAVESDPKAARLSNILNKHVKILFGLDLAYPQKYKHGFHDDNVILPADFCADGIDCFMRDLERFSDIKREILASLQPWVDKLGHKDRVLPRCIQHLLS